MGLLKSFDGRRRPAARLLVSPLFLVTLLAFLILYVPVFLIVVFSFNSNSIMVLPLDEFTLAWYSSLFKNGEIMRSLLNTLIVGLSAVVVSSVFGVSGAIALYRYKYRFENVLNTVIVFPLILPGIIVGLSLLTFFNLTRVRLSLFTVIIAHMTFCIPTVFKTVLARLRLLPKNLIEASLDLYANNWQTIVRVILPSIRTAVITGALLAFTLSFDETLITLLVTGTDNTLPMQIWGMMRRGFTPEVNAVATLMFLFSLAIAFLWGFKMKGIR